LIIINFESSTISNIWLVVYWLRNWSINHHLFWAWRCGLVFRRVWFLIRF
jgi:hypothetical protein